eukprot:639468-Prorocentrum_minimum.AAC.1
MDQLQRDMADVMEDMKIMGARLEKKRKKKRTYKRRGIQLQEKLDDSARVMENQVRPSLSFILYLLLYL